MRVLVFDTETTGLLDEKLDLSSPVQPHLVQLAAMLYDDVASRLLSAVCFLIKPEGYAIPPAACAVHGITTEVADAGGVPLVVATACFNHLAKAADLFVCHNFEFDRRVMEICYNRLRKPHPFVPGQFTPFCTMERLRPVMKLQPTAKMRHSVHRDKFKTPSLAEAYAFMTGGKTFDGHDAMADARVTLELYQWMTKKPEYVDPAAPVSAAAG